jgi:hypothetical protein
MAIFVQLNYSLLKYIKDKHMGHVYSLLSVVIQIWTRLDLDFSVDPEHSPSDLDQTLVIFNY